MKINSRAVISDDGTHSCSVVMKKKGLQWFDVGKPSWLRRMVKKKKKKKKLLLTLTGKPMTSYPKEGAQRRRIGGINGEERKQ